jgi:adenylate cyclase
MDQSYSPLDSIASNQRKLAILFVAVSDSPKLYESLGDTAAFRAIGRCMLMFQEEAAAHGGRVVKTIGDGSLCAFPDPNAAVRAACSMQQRAQASQVPAFQIGIRIGLHHGPVLVQGNEIYGDTVTTASRMAQFAAAGHIITTGETVALLAPHLRSTTRRIDVLPVNGKLQQVAAYHVMWAAVNDYAWVQEDDQPTTQRAPVTRVRLKHAGREVVVVDSITLGRNANNGIVLTHPRASRHHGFIKRCNGGFVFVDHSRNNTLVTMQNGEEFCLQRQSIALQGIGAISFGGRPSDKKAETIDFICESDGDVNAGRFIDSPAIGPIRHKPALHAVANEATNFVWVPEAFVGEKEEEGYTCFPHSQAKAKCFRTVEGRKEFLMRCPG